MFPASLGYVVPDKTGLPYESPLSLKPQNDLASFQKERLGR